MRNFVRICGRLFLFCFLFCVESVTLSCLEFANEFANEFSRITKSVNSTKFGSYLINFWKARSQAATDVVIFGRVRDKMHPEV